MENAKLNDDETQHRREFLSKIGKAAVTAPAVAMLVAASAEPAAAQYIRRPRRRR